MPAEIDVVAALDSMSVRRQNTSISYDADLSVPIEQWPETFPEQRRLVQFLATEYHREEFGSASMSLTIGIEDITCFSRVVDVSIVVTD